MKRTTAVESALIITTCDECDEEIEQCDECGSDFEDDTIVYCDCSTSHYCTKCAKKIKKG